MSQVVNASLLLFLFVLLVLGAVEFLSFIFLLVFFIVTVSFLLDSFFRICAQISFFLKRAINGKLYESTISKNGAICSAERVIWPKTLLCYPSASSLVNFVCY